MVDSKINRKIYEYIDYLMPKNLVIEYWIGVMVEPARDIVYDEKKDDIRIITVWNEDSGANIFRIYMPNYWDTDTARSKECFEMSPFVSFNNNIGEELCHMFGKLYHEPLKQWIKDRCSKEIPFEIKSIRE